MAFTHRYFPIEKAISIRKEIISFFQSKSEMLTQAWERYQEYMWTFPSHGMREDFILHTFYDGLTKDTKKQLDAAIGGDFCSLSIDKAVVAIDIIVNGPFSIYGDKSNPPLNEDVKKSLDSLHNKLRYFAINVKSHLDNMENQMSQLVKTSGKIENLSVVDGLLVASNLKAP